MCRQLFSALHVRANLIDRLAAQAQMVEVASFGAEVAPEHRGRDRDEPVDHGRRHARHPAEARHRDEPARHILDHVLVLDRRRRPGPLIRSCRLIGQPLERLAQRLAAEAVRLQKPRVDARHFPTERAGTASRSASSASSSLIKLGV